MLGRKIDKRIGRQLWEIFDWQFNEQLHDNIKQLAHQFEKQIYWHLWGEKISITK